jgi:dTDP-4-amino-4,6-dideoxygalactose transaminase
MKPALPPMARLAPRLKMIEESGTFSNSGPQLVELERRFAQRLEVGPERVVVLSNATLALSGLCQVLDGKNWRVPSWTFTATVLAILAARKIPSFIDVDLETHRAENEPGNSYNSILTLPFGVGLPKIWTSPGKYPSIIDGAASLGSIETLKNLPETSNLVFSLHATKYLGSGEGGLVVTGTKEIADELRSWSNFGFQGSRQSMTQGTNAKMSEIQAAVVHCALDSESEERSEWEKLRSASRYYEDQLSIGIPELSHSSIAPYWIVKFDSAENRDRVESALESASIGSRRWWSNGCHAMPAFATIQRLEDLSNTDQLASQTLGLPYFKGMTEKDFQSVAAVISSALE